MLVGNGGFWFPSPSFLWWGIPVVTEISQVERSPFLSKYREYMYDVWKFGDPQKKSI